MGERIHFTKNYSDLSTNQGFQFEFFCDKCGSGFRTKFKSGAKFCPECGEKVK